MRTTLLIDDDLLAVAKSLAAHKATSIGRVISELARKGLQSAPAKRHGDFPVFSVSRTARPITLEDVKQAEDEP